MSIWDAINNMAGQVAYDSARKAGASTGRARTMAKAADEQAGATPATGMSYDTNSSQPSVWQALASVAAAAPQAQIARSNESQNNIGVPIVPEINTASGANRDFEPKKRTEEDRYNTLKSMSENTGVGRMFRNVLGEEEMNKRLKSKASEEPQVASYDFNPSPEAIVQYLDNNPLYAVMVPKEERDKAREEMLSGENKSGKKASTVTASQATHPDEDEMDAAPPGFTGEELSKLYYGYTPSEINNMFEYELINAALADKDYQKALANSGAEWGDLYKTYVDLADLGETTDYSDRTEVFRDMLGLNPERADLEVKGLQQIFKEAGVINDKMSDEEKLEAALAKQYVDNLVDKMQWMNDSEYEAANPFTGNDLAEMFARQWDEQGLLGFPEDTFDNLQNGMDTLDREDIYAMINAGNLANQMEAGVRLDPSKWGGDTGFLNRAGGNEDWMWLPVGETENEEGYSVGDVWKGNRDYSAQAIGQALLDAYTNPKASKYNNLAANADLGTDADISNYLASIAEKHDKQGRKIGRKER